MNYKMVCIDMDGTLLGKGRKISQKNKDVIKEVHEKGIEIVVTTGRIYNNAAYFSHMLGVKSPVIAANGAIVRDKETNSIIYSGYIPTLDCLEIINVLTKNKITFQLYTADTIYSSNAICKIGTELFMTKQIGYEMLKIKYVRINTMKEWENILSKDDCKITKCIALSFNTKKIDNTKRALRKMNNITICGSGKRSIEINYKDISKGNAVKALGEYYGIRKEEIMCIGDNENDISMIKYAGLGVAMGNAIAGLKQLADYITDTNIEDGVAKALEKFIISN